MQTEEKTNAGFNALMDAQNADENQFEKIDLSEGQNEESVSPINAVEEVSIFTMGSPSPEPEEKPGAETEQTPEQKQLSKKNIERGAKRIVSGVDMVNKIIGKIVMGGTLRSHGYTDDDKEDLMGFAEDIAEEQGGNFLANVSPVWGLILFAIFITGMRLVEREGSEPENRQQTRRENESPPKEGRTRQNKCGRCGKYGHNRATCTEIIDDQNGD